MTPHKFARPIALWFAVFALGATSAIAEQTCADWMDQGNGTSWTTCVGDDGKQRCYLVSNTPGSTAYEISCAA